MHFWKTSVFKLGLSFTLLITLIVTLQSRYGRLSFLKYRYNVTHSQIDAKSVRILQRKIEENPKAAFEMNHLAGIYVTEAKRAGDTSFFERAEELAKKSLEILPVSNPTPYGILADIAQARHQFDQATKWLEKALAVDGGYLPAMQLRANIALALGDFKTALGTTTQLIEVRPVPMHYALRAIALSEMGRSSEALFEFQQSFRGEDFGDPELANWLRCMVARHAIHQGDWTMAEAALDEAQRVSPDAPLTYFMRGQLAMERGEYRSAAVAFMDAFTLSPQMNYLLLHGKAKLLDGDKKAATQIYAKAESLLEKELKTHPYGHKLDLVEAYLERPNKPKIEKAKQLLRQEVKVRRNYREVRYWFGVARYLNRNYSGSVGEVELALANGYQDPRFYGLLVLNWRAMGRERRAKHYLSVLREKYPHYNMDLLPSPPPEKKQKAKRIGAAD